jgi:membrane-associated phospholipid phosphatase
MFASGDGNTAFLVVGTFLPLATDGSSGGRRTVRDADALLTSSLLSEGIKALVRERRPDGSNRESFPSGHATSAFALAAMESHWHPRSGPLWYTGAALIAGSRVRLHRHHIHDILVGAALGIGTAIVEWHQPRGLIVAPVLPADRASGPAVGMRIAF